MGRKIFQKMRPEIDLTHKVVHHIDGNRKNNHYNNLISLTRKEHREIHVKFGGYKTGNNPWEKRMPKTIDNLQKLVNLYNDGIYL